MHSGCLFLVRPADLCLCLCEKEATKRFFNEKTSKKQTSCRLLCLRMICVRKRKEIQKYFSKKTNTTLMNW
ncbi:hypothetical protein HanRHA438_Chr06g0250131 [Helianthus annuus]|nr:hypothetical protein HanRHA438_Chr06g0250131 [Helianthus annuus]